MSQLLFNAAAAELEAGNFASSAQLCRTGLATSPDDPGLLFVLGLAQQSAGDIEAAVEPFARLTQLQPGMAEHWSNLGVVLRQLGRHEDAEAQFQHALALPHAAHDTLINYGLLLQDMGRIAEARHRFLDACELGDSADARIYAALACIDCGDIRRAQALVPAPDTWPQLPPPLRRDLTKALIQLGQVEQAERLLEADAATGDPIAMVRLATLHERTNRVDDARALLARARAAGAALDPDTQADILSVEGALALRGKDDAQARSATRALLDLAGLPPQARASAHFTMARIADKAGNAAEAMSHLEQAHAINFELARETLPEIAESPDEPLRIASKWLTPEQAAFPAGVAPAAEESPVFIVGFPRSGTTMLEQMLDAHPDYVSMDERIIIQYCVEAMEGFGLSYPYDLRLLDEAQLAELRALYWAEARKIVDIPAGRTLVDKNPLNMLRVPMIRRLFPDARIILALRHPCDVLLSCYMQNFRSPAFMVLCSTLERLAKSYVNAMRFWIHHAPLLCPDALVLRYEDTVGDFPAQVARIAAYLGIREPAFLAEFSRHAAAKGYISTPSYAQVIEPVNRRAVARWLPYRDWFDAALPILRPVAEHWGYALPEE